MFQHLATVRNPLATVAFLLKKDDVGQMRVRMFLARCGGAASLVRRLRRWTLRATSCGVPLEHADNGGKNIRTRI